MEDEFKPFKLGLRQIESDSPSGTGYIVTRLGGEIYKPTIGEALKELRLSIDAMEKEVGVKPSVSTSPQTSKPQQPVGVR